MRIAYIDFQNIKLGVRELGRDIDWERFFNYLQTKYTLDYVKICIGYMSQNHMLYESLKNIGYTLVFKETIEIDGKIKGNIDTCLMREALQDMYESSTLFSLLISGDGDFDELIKTWKRKNKSYKLLLPNHTKPSQLLLKCTSVSHRQFLHTIQHLIQTKKPDLPK